MTKAADHKRPQDIVGLDFSCTGVKAVRLKLVGGQFNLLAAEIFPSADGTGAPFRPVFDKRFMKHTANNELLVDHFIICKIGVTERGESVSM